MKQWQAQFPDVKKVVNRQPGVFCLSIEENLEPKMRWLKKDLGFTEEEAAKMVKKCPTLFCLSIQKNLEPKRQLLREWFSHESVIGLIPSFPQILSYSRERLKVRKSLLLEKGQLTADRLRNCMRLPEARFEKWYDNLDVGASALED